MAASIGVEAVPN